VQAVPFAGKTDKRALFKMEKMREENAIASPIKIHFV